MHTKHRANGFHGRYSRAFVVGMSMLLTLLVPTVWLRAQGQPPQKGGAPSVPKKPTVPPPGAPAGGNAGGKAGGGAAAANNPPAGSAPAIMPQGPITSDDDPRVKAAVAKAAAFLRTPGVYPGSQGPLALLVHALAKIHEKFPDIVPADDPTLQRAVNDLRKSTNGGFKPASPGGHDNYEAGVVAMALTAADGQAYKIDIGYVAGHILAKQTSTGGAWGYDGRTSSTGDTSQTQYAVLGMWEAASGAGINIPKSAWDKVAKWLIDTQHPDGGYEYNPPPKDPNSGLSNAHATHTMTVASLGSLYICRDHLPGGKRKSSRGLLLQIQDEDEKADASYKATTTPDQFSAAIAKSTDWIIKNYTLFKATGEADAGGGVWKYYYLYAFERFATLSGQKIIGGHDWYDEGARFLISTQNSGGSWEGGFNNVGDAAFSTLFLIRSTSISQKIHQRRLGRGTLISGRGLPKNLGEMESTPSGMRSKAVTGKIGNILEKVESGKPEEIESAALGALAKIYEKKWSAGGAEGDQLRKYYQKGVATKNSELIKFAMKALALTGDYRVVPVLIDGMYFEDDAEVQLHAHQQLCLISRKFNGFGAIYPEEATLDEWKAEIDRWKQWYREVRPEYVFEDDIDVDVDKKVELSKSGERPAKSKQKSLTIPGVMTIDLPGPDFEWKPPKTREEDDQKFTVYTCESTTTKGVSLTLNFSPQLRGTTDDAERAAHVKKFYDGLIEPLKGGGFSKLEVTAPRLDPPVPNRVTFRISGVSPAGTLTHIQCVCVFGKYIYFFQAVGLSPSEVDQLAKVADTLTEF